jgi:hypothetical protein
MRGGDAEEEGEDGEDAAEEDDDMFRCNLTNTNYTINKQRE